jgi:hypothetical protein
VMKALCSPFICACQRFGPPRRLNLPPFLPFLPADVCAHRISLVYAPDVVSAVLATIRTASASSLSSSELWID